MINRETRIKRKKDYTIEGFIQTDIKDNDLLSLLKKLIQENFIPVKMRKVYGPLKDDDGAMLMNSTKVLTEGCEASWGLVTTGYNKGQWNTYSRRWYFYIPEEREDMKYLIHHQKTRGL
jgi:hypothetical protein